MKRQDEKRMKKLKDKMKKEWKKHTKIRSSEKR